MATCLVGADFPLRIEDNSCNTRIIGRYIQSDPASEESIALIKEWIRDCDTRHALCKRPSSTTLPSRVIDVGSSTQDSEPRLVISEGRSDEYVALTHVWGGLVPVRTTTKNLHDHLSRLPLSSLPPSFRDAVQVTRRLGIRYLWIDALCIVQDSPQDWEAECARMGRVYCDSIITIAAVDADNSKTGFLNHRASSPLNVPSIPLSPPTSSSHDFLISVIPRDPGAHLDHHSPLSVRAWCLQEKILSSRVLYFGTDQTYFNCNTLTHLEAYGAAPPSQTLYHSLNFGKSSLADDIQRLKDKRTNFKRIAVWHRIVNEYATRALTNKKDKLPALSALAADIAKITGDRYLAGLWFEDLNENLIWVVENPTLDTYATSSMPYTAPSWSWASFHGPLEFKGAAPAAARILKAEVTLAGLDPFGRVSGGTLVVCGRCKPAVVRYNETSRVPDFTYKSQGQSLYSYFSEWDQDVELGRCSFDYVSDRVAPDFDLTKNPKVVFCLALQGGPRAVRYTVMVLTPVDDVPGRASAHRRIGMGYVQVVANGMPLESRDFETWERGEPAEILALQAKDWFESCPEQEWTIV